MCKGLGSLIFFIVPDEIVYSLFNFFYILWNSIYLNYVPKFGSEELVYNYLFNSQRESHSVKLALILSQLKLSREELTKLTQLF